MRLVLASGSPRRRELLALLGLAFDVVPTDVDEAVRPGEQPIDLVHRLAIDKVEAVAAIAPVAAIDGPDLVVLAADTIVEVAGEILGKPDDAADARRMLRSLSAHTHVVHTAVAVRRDGLTLHDVVTTAVSMTAISEAAIDWYLATGEPMDKAGAYAIQGAGGAFVTAIEGSASNVVGLPLTTVVDLLSRHGIAVAGR